MSEESTMYTIGKEMGEAAAAVQNALADKKVSVAEGIGIAKELGTLGFVAVKNRDELGAGFKDGLDETEIADLKEGFAAGYDITSDDLEATVEAGFNAALSIVNGVAGLFINADDDETPAE